MILCGGSGERLWPASRPWRPKPFLPLVGARTPFQQAVLRGAAIAGAREVLVVGGDAHAGLIERQLSALGVDARLLLEPEPRDTAAAIAVAAHWILRGTPGAVLAVLPADHHVPDVTAFADAVARALPAAESGALVTLGLRPTGPSSAFGYILPRTTGDGVAGVAAFVEKPAVSQARALIAQGALWNAGVFVAGAQSLCEELARWAPEVAQAAVAALDLATVSGARVCLANAEGPRLPFDRAVMEKTDRGAVLPVDFAWSDLGAWDAVLAADPAGAVGAGVSVTGGERVVARAAAGMRVAVVGLSDVAVVAERDAVLVAALGDSEGMRDAVRTLPPPQPFADLDAAAQAHDLWLRTAALPLWSTLGVDPQTGAFREALTWTGAPADDRRRTRVQARQAFVYARAAAEGLPGPWLGVAQAGMRWLLTHGRREDGLFVSALDLTRGTLDPTARLYEHAFILLALAALDAADPGDGLWRAEAVALRQRLDTFRHAAGGFREAGETPFQANAQMHLLEATLAWETCSAERAWSGLSDELAGLALNRLIDGRGVLHEVFDADWCAAAGAADLVEPGHQFEWAWLLARWGARRGDAAAPVAARRLFQAGRAGFDASRGVVVNALWPDLTVRDAGARLWPQTEHLKSALLLGETEAALQAANGLATYLDTPARGAWRERMRPDGGFLEEPSPATSLYHLFLAVRELARAQAEMC